MRVVRRHLRPALTTLVAFAAGAALMHGLRVADTSAERPAVQTAAACVENHVHIAPQSPGGVWAQLATFDQLLSGAAASRVIYLNREGATLWPGVDDASENRSSVVRASGLTRVELPAYDGDRATWQRVLRCVRDRFSAYDVHITDRRPVHRRDYLMAVVGGTARALARPNAHLTGGLAPFNGESIPRSVVFVFSEALGGDVNAICETAAMELAHAYGLDHAYDCGDVMSYLPRCGPRRFMDQETPCGEHQPRLCATGAATQNSHRYLLRVLGARRTAERQSETPWPVDALLRWTADPATWASATAVAVLASTAP